MVSKFNEPERRVYLRYLLNRHRDQVIVTLKDGASISGQVLMFSQGIAVIKKSSHELAQEVDFDDITNIELV